MQIPFFLQKVLEIRTLKIQLLFSNIWRYLNMLFVSYALTNNPNFTGDLFVCLFVLMVLRNLKKSDKGYQVFKAGLATRLIP